MYAVQMVYPVTPLEIARREQRLNREELAARTEGAVHPDTIGAAERGEAVRRATMVVLALALGKPVDELFSNFRRAA